MNNRIKIILIAVVLMGIIFGADRILKMQENKYIIGNQDEMSDEQQTGSNVLEVTSSTFSVEVLESEKIVLIDFYATWCNPCKMLSPTVEQIANEREDIKVVKIDVDENQDIANKYRIYSMPTLVVIADGVEINRAIGVISKEEIENMLKN